MDLGISCTNPWVTSHMTLAQSSDHVTKQKCLKTGFKKPVLREILTTDTPIRFPKKKRFLRKSDDRISTRFFPNIYIKALVL